MIYNSLTPKPFGMAIDQTPMEEIVLEHATLDPAPGIKLDPEDRTPI